MPYQQFLIFLGFLNTFSEAAVQKFPSKWVLLKISQQSELKTFKNSFFIENHR